MKQYATFYVNGNHFGIHVIDVQEVTRMLPITAVRLAPSYVRGVTNLRGQIAMAVGLRNLIDPSEVSENENEMIVVCRCSDGLLSLLVDKIGDVVDVEDELFEAIPNHLDEKVKRLLAGVYKIKDSLLSIIEIEKLTEVLNQTENENAA